MILYNYRRYTYNPIWIVIMIESFQKQILKIDFKVLMIGFKDLKHCGI